MRGFFCCFFIVLCKLQRKFAFLILYIYIARLKDMLTFNIFYDILTKRMLLLYARKEKFMIHSFLLIGQSNMAGRGFFNEVEKINNDKINVLRNGDWVPSLLPVNHDRSTSGVNLAESFADAYSKEHGVAVGLIPCADGGTTLDQWAEGGVLFDHAVFQAKLAQRSSKLVGILWHQGESDCLNHLYSHYEEKFLKIMEAFRRQLDAYDIPFILGGLGDYLPDCSYDGNFKNYKEINKTLEKIAKNEKMTGFVSAEGLTSNSDFLHFNAKSLREFGLRYYQVFKTFEQSADLTENTIGVRERSEIEKL